MCTLGTLRLRADIEIFGVGRSGEGMALAEYDVHEVRAFESDALATACSK
jgi:hypothetical protein